MSWEEKHSEELRLLGNALQTEGFRFILISYNRPSAYRLVREWLRERFPERSILELPLLGLDYRKFSDRLEAFSQGIVLIPDMSQVLSEENKAFALAFNQRRDHFARKKLAFICFLHPDYIKNLMDGLPDWWSLRSLELEIGGEFVRKSIELGLSRSIELDSSGNWDNYFSLLLSSPEEREAEITRLLRQLEDADEDNWVLRQQLFYFLGRYYLSMDEYTLAENAQQKALELAEKLRDAATEVKVCHELGEIAFGQDDNNTALHYFKRAQEKTLQTGAPKGYDMALTLQKMGRVYAEMKDKEKALQCLEEALQITEKSDINKLSILRDIASVYRNLEEVDDKYAEWVLKALDLALEKNDTPAIFEISKEIGFYLCEQGGTVYGLSFLEMAFKAVSQLLIRWPELDNEAIALAEAIRHYQQVK
ncbi:MAG TPA: tetratricopeptide repeat protein [Saprospiraceae bacterium]|nr:tetratricopeptide repeat protein [Saprospiraceae bacterium]HMQ83650.1 tetratricopeptide repeat protein [Saprospiraceae bacterium]